MAGCKLVGCRLDSGEIRQIGVCDAIFINDTDSPSDVDGIYRYMPGSFLAFFYDQLQARKSKTKP